MLSLGKEMFSNGKFAPRNPLVRPRSAGLRILKTLSSASTWIFTPAAVLSLLLLVLLFPGLFFSMNGTSFADSGAAYVYDLSLTTSGSVSFGVTATQSGRISSGLLVANVATNSPVGYNLAISTKALNGGVAGNLTRVGSTANPITPTSGTIASPVVFSSNVCNRWGFALPKGEASGVSNNWNDAYSVQNNQLTTDSSNTLRYAAVPTSNTTIRNQGTGTGGSRQETNLFFASCAGGAGGNLPSGTYQAAITLTAVLNSIPTPTITSIEPSVGYTTGNSLLTITGTNFGTSSSPNLTAAYIGGTRTGNRNESNTGDVSSDWSGGYPCTDLTIISQTQATCRTAGVDNPKTPTEAVPSNGSNMQAMGAFNCKSMTAGQVVTLVDARDNKSYHIKKMPDEKCWMMDNLAYAGGTSNGGSNYFGDEHALTFANATSSSPWNSTTGITTRFVTTNNYTGSDQSSSGVQLIQNTTATLTTGTQCTNSVTGDSPMDSKCLSYLYNFCSAAALSRLLLSRRLTSS